MTWLRWNSKESMTSQVWTPLTQKSRARTADSVLPSLHLLWDGSLKSVNNRSCFSVVLLLLNGFKEYCGAKRWYLKLVALLHHWNKGTKNLTWTVFLRCSKFNTFLQQLETRSTWTPVNCRHLLQSCSPKNEQVYFYNKLVWTVNNKNVLFQVSNIERIIMYCCLCF